MGRQLIPLAFSRPVNRLRNGDFQGKVQEEIGKLSCVQLERAAIVMEEYLNGAAVRVK